MTTTSKIVITIIEKIALVNLNIYFYRKLKIFAHTHMKALYRSQRVDSLKRDALKFKM